LRVNIIQLPVGEHGAKDKDCIHIVQTGAGVFELDTSTLVGCSIDEESEAVIGSEPYDSYEAAEAAGLAIAAENCVEELYISRQLLDGSAPASSSETPA
jgi:hypothetical protein